MTENPQASKNELQESMFTIVVSISALIMPLISLYAWFNKSENTNIYIGITAFAWLIFAILAVSVHKKEERKKELFNKSLYDIPNFNPDQGYVQSDGFSAIMLDEKSKAVCFAKYNHSSNDVEKRIFSHKDIISVEVVEDGLSVIETSRGSQFGGAIVGGALLGGVGAVVGGLSGKKTVNKKVQKIELKVTVNDLNNPIYNIVFLSGEKQKNDMDYKKAADDARHWQGLLSVLIKQAEQEDINAKCASIPNNNFVADEIVKLGELLKKELITEDEFAAQKKKLLESR